MSSEMPIYPSYSSKRGFPLGLFAAAFVISILTTVFGGWQTWQMHQRLEYLSDKHVHITEYIGRIMLFDEVLTMSARMTAGTGDFSYEKRYDQFDPLLTKEIDEIRAVLPHAEIEQFVGETDEANIALVKMERQAFALTHQGKRQEAAALLISDEYLRLKKIYAGGMKKTADAAALVIERDYQHIHSLAVFSAVVSAIGILVLLATWFFAAKSARSWATKQMEFKDALRKSHDELEVLVKQRTADLLSSNEQLQHEIAEHKQIELALQESESKFRKITESANDTIIIATDAGNIIGWNAAAERTFGYTEAEINGQPLTVLMPERFRNLHSTGLARVAAGGTPHLIGKTVELAGLRKDGSEFPLELSLAQWQTANDQFFNAIIRDITERKKTEMQLLESELQYRTLADSGQALIWGAGTDKLCNYFNKVWLEFTGRGMEQEMGNGWAEGVHPDDFKHCLDVYVSAFERHEKFSMIYQLRRHDGEYRWIQDDGCPRYDSKGEFIGYIGYCLDVTERKKAEAELQGMLSAANRSRQAMLSMIEDQKQAGESLRKLSLAVEQNPNSIVITGLDGNIEYVNAAFTKATGYSFAEVAGKNPSLLGSGKTPKTTYDKLWDCMSRGELWKGEFINRHKDGSEYIESVLISPVRQADGRVTNYLAIEEDITERKRMEAEVLHLNAELENKVAARTAALEQARLEAEQANRAKSEFLATMSHEIRTPMNGVIGMIDVLQQSSLTGPQVEMANIIHESAFSLLTVINDILDFSKIEAGKLQIENLPMPVADVVEGVCESLYPLALKKGVELALFTDPAIPAEAMGDAGRLRQILVNLTNNAIKFSGGQQRQGKVSLRALLVESTPEQVTLEFRVTDNGIGMDEETRARLFAPFTQADSSTTRSFGGTGLGLVISRRLARIMGGEITLHSELGKGTTLNVRIPFERAPVNPEINEAPSLVAGLTCLVADGSESLAGDLAAYLVHAGAVVERAAGLAAVKQWIAARPPGLCIVVIDTEGVSRPLDEMRAAARTRPNMDVRFVAIERGGRRHCRSVAADLVGLDAEVMHRRAFLEAVAIAAGRAKQSELEGKRGANVKLTLSREEARLRGSLILIAEDNEINQKVILQQLMLLGQTADIANNGREALKRWQSGDYAILFADLHMPEMDGYELTAAIRAAEKSGASETSKPRIPIIAFTANALKGEAEHCLALGMDDYLSKPVQLTSLKAMLEKWMPVAVSPPIETTSTKAAPPAPPDRKTLAPVDVNVLKALIGDDDAMIREFLRDFRLSAAKIAVELRTACTAGQAAAAGALAHKLKSSARSVGALALGELCAEMEQVGKAGDMRTLMALLPRFEPELASVERFLDEY